MQIHKFMHTRTDTYIYVYTHRYKQTNSSWLFDCACVYCDRTPQASFAVRRFLFPSSHSLHFLSHTPAQKAADIACFVFFATRSQTNHFEPLLICTSHVSYESVMSRMNEPCLIWMWVCVIRTNNPQRLPLYGYCWIIFNFLSLQVHVKYTKHPIAWSTRQIYKKSSQPTSTSVIYRKTHLRENQACWKRIGALSHSLLPNMQALVSFRRNLHIRKRAR